MQSKTQLWSWLSTIPCQYSLKVVSWNGAYDGGLSAEHEV